MSRLSREQKRELKRQRSAAGAGGQQAAGATPIEVHVPASADTATGAVMPGAVGAQGCATVGGMPVVAAPGETVQGAILNYLHRLALATGHPVLASIHDERIGYVVPLQVHVDGSSRYTAEPVQVAPPAQVPHASRPHLPSQDHRHPAPASRRAPDFTDPAAHPFTEPRPEEHPQALTPEQGAHPQQAPAHRPQPPVQEHPRFSADEHHRQPQPPEHRPQSQAPEQRPQPQAPEQHPQPQAPELRPQPPAQGHPHFSADERHRQPQPPEHRPQTQAPEQRPQAPEQRPHAQAPEHRSQPQAPDHQPPQAPEQRPQAPVGDVPQAPGQGAPQGRPETPAPPVPVSAEAQAPEAPAAPRRDKATYVLRAVPESAAGTLPGPESGTPLAPAPASATTPEAAPAPDYPPMAPPAPPARPESAPRPAPVRGPEPAVTAEFVPQPVSEAPVRPEARPEAAGFAAQAASEPSARPEPGPAPVRRPEPAVTAEFVMQPVPEPVVRPDAQPVPEPVVRPEARSVPRPEAGARSVPRPEAAGFAGQSASEPSVRPEPGPAPVRRPEPAVTAEFVAQPAPPAPVPPVPAPPAAVPAPPVPAPVAAAEPASAGESGRDAGPAHGALARTPDPAPVPEAEPVEPGVPTPSTFVLRAVPEPKPLPGSASTRVLRAVPESAAGSVAAPTGEFGPAPEATPAPEARQAAPARKPSSPMEALSLLGPEPEPDPKPTPARGFDAVAEAVLAPSPQEPAADRDAASAFLAEPVARINEAVKMGRIEAAAGMAERAVAEAAQSLGHEHPEVLKLRELTAYIAYLAGDALRSFHLSLELARVRRRHRDNGAAYGNVQSAAAAWRAVRDPLQGLHLGRDLIGLWTELTADEGPAADDLEQLESARTRMVRLAERARLAGDMPYNRPSRAHGE